MKPLFQFSLRNALLTTFWASVWGSSFSLLSTLDAEPFHTWGWPYISFVLLLVVLFLASPFIAIGALFGRAWTGLAFGLAFMLIVLIMTPIAAA